jgi:hypothetical protein
MSTFACPNTGCSYRFDAEHLPPAAMVTCPVCRTRFPYRAGSIPSLGSQGSVVPPAADAGPRPVRPRYAPASRGMHTWLFLLGFTLFLLAVFWVLYNTARKRHWMPTKESGPYASEPLNFKYQVPDDWNNDTEARNGLRVNTFALKKGDQDAWVAMFAQDYRDRNPRPVELVDAMRAKLRGYFGGVDKVEVSERGQATLAGQTASVHDFSGEVDGILMRGECHLMTYKGIAYAFFAWAPADQFDQHQRDFQSMRDRLALLDKRADWVEARPNVAVFTPPGANFQIEDRDGVWKERKPAGDTPDPRNGHHAVDPKDIDPQAVMALRAAFPTKNPRSKGIDFLPEAEAVVLVLDKPGDDPIKTARERILARFKEEDKITETQTTLENVAESPAGVALPDNGPQLTRFQSRNDRDSNVVWFYVVSVLNVDGKLVVVETKCRNSRLRPDARHMEPFMVNLAASLKKKE